MPADDDDTRLLFPLPSVCRKKVTAAFDGGRISSDGGVLLLAGADKRLGLIDTLAAIIPDHRHPALITHSMTDILRGRIFAIACGYPDADDLDDLRRDPAFKLACGRLPESGDDLHSQPTMSRWENAPNLRTLIRMARAMVDLWCQSHRRPDDQQAEEVRAHLRRLVRRIRQHWPRTVITIRGDGHYGRREAMAWCEENDVRYVFGLSKNAVLDDLVYAKADEVRTRRATGKLDVVRDYTETRYAAKSWPHARRVVARFEATPKGFDTRYVVTNIAHCGPQWLYDSLYCARGQAENLIKRHKGQLASDRTSCRSPLANQMRLILHTAAYWLMRTLRDAIPRSQKLASGEFSTIRLRLLKIAVRIKETASRVRLAFASNCPDAALFRGLVGTLILRPT
jgi:hypothetical protein